MQQTDNSDLLYELFATRPYKATASYVIDQPFEETYLVKKPIEFIPDGLPKQVGNKNVKS
jgi:hypothetical protein